MKLLLTSPLPVGFLPRSTVSLTQLLTKQTPTGPVKMKKFYYPKGFLCSFCSRSDHDKSFCPCLPTEPSKEHKQIFVDKLLEQPRQRLNIYEGMDWEEACERMISMGTKLNEGSPWAGETDREFDLRKKLGFWKAIGADKTVLSWIGYGVDMRFHGHAFPQPPNT